MPINSVVLAGLRFSITLPERGSTHSPLMKFLNALGAADVAMQIPPVGRAANSALKCCVLAELIPPRAELRRSVQMFGVENCYVLWSHIFKQISTLGCVRSRKRGAGNA